MKKILSVVIVITFLLVSLSCAKKSSNANLLPLILLSGRCSDCVIMTSIDLDAVGNAVIAKTGTLTPPGPLWIENEHCAGGNRPPLCFV